MTTASVTIPISSLRISPDVYPRDGVDHVRVAMFAGLLKEGQELEPIVAVPRPDTTYLVGDGVTRTEAHVEAERTEIQAVLVVPEPDESPIDCAYRIALEYAVRSALPLTRAERKRNAKRLMARLPDLSHREIARRLGVSHASIDSWAREPADEVEPDTTAIPGPGPTADAISRQLASYVDRLESARDIFDLVAKRRMGRHLADAFESRFGDDALRQLERIATWSSDAVSVLRSRGS
jgi:ParB-like chromosome segregation protein Spo0J